MLFMKAFSIFGHYYIIFTKQDQFSNSDIKVVGPSKCPKIKDLYRA